MNDIIVGVDQSDTARRAAETAADLAAKCGVNLHIVMCVPPGRSKEVGSGGDRWLVDPLAQAETFLADLGRALPHDQISTSIETGDPAGTMCDEAARRDAQMIVVGNRRVQGVSRVLGSVAADVTKHAPCHVLIAHTTGG